MNKSIFYIISVGLFILLSSCEDNLNSPAVNPDLKANKKVLMEVFTSITCLNCIQANIFCDNITDLKGITINDTNVMVINYHPSFFPIDPFYQFNKELNKERQQYYAITFIPSGFCEGQSLPPPFSASEWANQINSELMNYNEAVISIENTFDTASRSGTIKIMTELREPFQINDLKLHLIITEDHIFYNAPTGSKFYNNIAREMLSNAGGENIQLEYGHTSTIVKKYSARTGINLKNSSILAFIQNNTTKKILVAEKIKLIQAFSEN